MEDLGLSLIVIAVTVVLVGLIFWLVSAQKRKREASLCNLASMNGWIYEPVKDRNSSGYRLRKGDWVIEAVNQSNTNSSDNSSSTTVTSLTRWFSDSIRTADGLVLIGPRMPDVNLAGIGEMMRQAALRVLIGAEAENVAGIQQEELGSLELMKRYMVWTNRVETANKLLEAPVENALIHWPLKLVPLIKFSPAGLEIKIQGARLYKDADIIALVKLGNLLIDNAR